MEIPIFNYKQNHLKFMQIKNIYSHDSIIFFNIIGINIKNHIEDPLFF